MCAAQRNHAVHGLRTEQGTVADLSKGRTSDGSALRKGETGRQAYRLEVPGALSAAALSVVSFKAVERLGEPYVVTVALTHPLEQGRADYVGKPATFVIDPGDGTEPRTFAGCITRFTKTAETRDFHGYEIDLEPLVARLRLTRATRIYQHKTAPETIEAILRRHGLLGHQFAFKLLRKYPQHKFRFQYQMSDWAYIRLLMEQEGIYSYFIPGEFGEFLVFGDDIDHYIYKPQLHVPYRETAGLESGVEAVHGLRTHAKAVAESFLVADYNPDPAWEPIQGEANVARSDKTTYGRPYVFGTHHLDMAGAKWEAQLRHEAEVAGQVVYEGESSVLALRPARILRMDKDLPDAPHGQVIIEVIHSGARDAAYRNSFKSIPSDRRFRLPLDEANWPKIPGTLSARITSPSKYPYAYLTPQGYYTVRFEFDFETWPGGGECVPLRLAKPFAGAFQTGFHFPLIDGTEAAIAFRDGNPNKPYIAHVHHNSCQPDLITNQDRWLSRNVIRTQRDNKIELEDWEGQEHIKLSTEHSGKTQLTLGHMVDGKWKRRGEGFELRTDAQGAVRAGGGLFVSADMQKKALGKQNDMTPAMDQFQLTQAQAQELAQVARAAQAEVADMKAENQWLKDELADLKRAVIALSAPNGIGLATPDRVMVAAGKDVSVTTSSRFNVNAVRNVAIVAGEVLSLLAYRMGVKLFAVRGDVQIQAQSGAIQMASEKDATITSSNGRVVIEAKDELLFKCGGSYLRLTCTGIEDATRGDRISKAAAHVRQGPASIPADLPVLPKPAATACALDAARTGMPFARF